MRTPDNVGAWLDIQRVLCATHDYSRAVLLLGGVRYGVHRVRAWLSVGKHKALRVV